LSVIPFEVLLHQLFLLRHNASLALILESEALAVDADDDRVVKDTIEHRHGKHAVAGEGRIPAAEGEIRS
jgi:hypothetical protein